LHKRSPLGTAHWYAAYWAALDELADDPLKFGLAAEATRLRRDIREMFFKTRRSARYRLVFAVVQNQVHVMRVREPGRRPLRLRDIEP
jgi:hypothetical protein